jgi:hypothetical protein
MDEIGREALLLEREAAVELLQPAQSGAESAAVISW